MDQNVGLGHQVFQDRPPGGRLQIQGHALLVGVEMQEQAAALPMGLVVEKGAISSGHVTPPGSFNLDNLSTHVGQQLAGIGSGKAASQLQNLNAF